MFLFILTLIGKSVANNAFKYISCSYLSPAGYFYVHTAKKFKYISCSYLSNFSLALVYGNLDSNTSHVLIYPTVLTLSYIIKTIQIHLMFLFITSIHHKSTTRRNSNTSHVLIYHCCYLCTGNGIW